ncbi:SAM-dependent methyltransferase [Saccharopolyspora sp. TS4A08]|uniref:SAM-dependent methyltransferase n=1 Tax=Saccharopolyspora ipomoeae TaxID=3042027 RepID=A0ABT6PTZ7_9PSEU|nr:SAM-dependent methyltransferase [Saccharopolyspora sp. TS4A08]MDI2031487.1 SAM-dependent methyltransferase [Saccharopolyspora sp. TS4A08]
MMDTRSTAIREMDINRPASARMYDAFLGGCHNFGVERSIVERLETALPGIGGTYRENRAFLRRAVEYLLAHGVRQFLDLGSGIPTIGHVHEVARRRTRHFRVVYVDNEPLTVAHSKPLLAAEINAAITHADIRDPKSVLCSPEVRALLDLDEPVGLLMSSVLHYLPDSDQPAELVATYREVLAPGSHLVISHVTDSHDPAPARVLAEHYAETSDPIHLRDTREIESFFGDLDPVPPGAACLADWRPDPGTPVPSPYRLVHGGIARKG